jgi:hypothetical protein
MPSIVGNVKILSVGPSSIINFGDAYQITPSSTSKTFAGAGSFVTGDLSNTRQLLSNTTTWDPDGADAQAIADPGGVVG